MKLRRLTAIVALLFILPLLTSAACAGKRVLIFVHSDGCGPCVQFDTAWTSDRQFRDAVQDAFEVREWDWEVPAQRAMAVASGVSVLPTYLLFDGTTVVHKHSGFVNTPAGKAEFLRQLGITIRSNTPAPQQPESPPPAVSQQPAGGDNADHKARRDILALAAQTRDIENAQRLTQQSVEALKVDVSQSSDRISNQVKQSTESTRSEVVKITDHLRETVKQSIEKFAGDSHVGTTAATQEPAATGIAAWVLKAGSTGAAAYFGLPIGAAAVVAGGVSWLVSRRRSRREPHHKTETTERGNTVSVIRDTDQRQTTANHYVVKETDRVGEAYKEALRRTVAAFKSDKPGIVDVASQIEHVASELLRGQNVQTRASQTPRPGIWADSESS